MLRLLSGGICINGFSCGLNRFSREESSNLLLEWIRQITQGLGDKWERVCGGLVFNIFLSSNYAWIPIFIASILPFLKDKLILSRGGAVTCCVELRRRNLGSHSFF